MENSYQLIPCQFLDQTLIAIFNCFGFSSSTAQNKTTSQKEKEEKYVIKKEEKEEEEYVVVKDRAIVLSTIRIKGIRNTKKKVNRRRKPRNKEEPSEGEPGQVNKISTNGRLTLMFQQTSSSSSSSHIY